MKLTKTRKIIAAAIGGLALICGGSVSVWVGGGAPAVGAVGAGINYQICGANSSYLTSPWTLTSLPSGSGTFNGESGTEEYTVAQYEALSGYGTTIPPLPNYISGESSSTIGAVIFQSTATVSSITVPEQPILVFFEGGSYGQMGLAAVNGDEIIGGSGNGVGEPSFAQGGTSSGGVTQNNTNYNSPSALATIGGSSSLTPGTTTFTLTSSRLPIVVGEILTISGQDVAVAAVSGPQSGYTITLQSNSPIAQTIATGTSVSYDSHNAGGVTAQYLNIQDDLNSGTGTINAGGNWTIENDDISNGYTSSNVLAGRAIYDGASAPVVLKGSTMEYNCISYEGYTAIHEFSYDSQFSYNEVLSTPMEAGDNGDFGNKWWATLNSNIVDNYWYKDGPGGSFPIWFDDGNTGELVQGNYFQYCAYNCVQMETSFNADITQNVFLDADWQGTDTGAEAERNGAVGINSSGGWPIPGSNYNNELLITDNTFTDNWEGLDIWISPDRSCWADGENSGTAPYDNAGYCTGGYPNGDGQFSTYNYPDNVSGGNGTTAGSLQATASSGSTTLTVRYGLPSGQAVGDYIGFTGPGSSGYPTTTTTSTSAASSFTGSQTLPVASTTGFTATGGQVQVDTSTLSPGQGFGVGAILSYTGVGTGDLTGVSFVRGSGNLVSGGWVNELEPYEITAISGYYPFQTYTISPGLASTESSGATIYNDGSCFVYLTAGASPTSPVAPNGLSYYDGCVWETKNITVSGNTFNFNASNIVNGPNIWGSTAYQSCVAGSVSSYCGTNFMQAQLSTNPWSGYEIPNSLASHTGFMTPITSTWNGVPTNNNGEPAWDNVWSNNTYTGSIYFATYSYTGLGNSSCTAPSFGDGWGDPCFVDVSHWQSEWHQD